ncbi:EPIDERMAL PATTERNING FACTOR-like protein 1 [Abrus precatorius]|uniref:Epidermal patterning factor-like protein n=1 Tax=Abrus precatorius TaxID=3816 RepID=A0A8B8MHY1_ABRPR|nr:EPIDERMAL PATTERNING FACTOR-like protein 1 [Abrus precatorius]
MASLNSYKYTTTTTLLIIVLLLHLLFPVSSSNNQPQPSIFPRELLFEEKNRLGSIPPSCHNKCNDCHPCMAVQVPSLPSHDSVLPDLTKTAAVATFLNPSTQGNRYSNYKPLGWKCHCGDHFFNP